MKIFGQVLDTNDEPMALANITIVTGVNANTMGTHGDLDGNFVLESPNIESDSRFKVSYVGYVSQFFNTNELQGKKVKLKDDVEELQEVVITAGSKPSNSSTKTNVVQSSKKKFVQHLQDHKFVYAGLGGLAGIILIARAFKR
jgi:hypothetical protein